MKFSYDKKSDALYLRFNKEQIVESDQVADNVVLDYDKSGRIIGLEILDASKKFAKNIYTQFQKNQLTTNVEFVAEKPAKPYKAKGK